LKIFYGALKHLMQNFYICKNLNAYSMSRKIAETPILYGKDAERFQEAMKNVKPASAEEKERARAAYEKLRKIATFDF